MTTLVLLVGYLNCANYICRERPMHDLGLVPSSMHLGYIARMYFSYGKKVVTYVLWLDLFMDYGIGTVGRDIAPGP